MANFSALAPELVDIICEYLQLCYQKTALYNLCLTSRALKPVAQPYLYRTVNLYNIVPFLRTILENPKLAKRVQNLAAGHHGDCLSSLQDLSDDSLVELHQNALEAGVVIQDHSFTTKDKAGIHDLATKLTDLLLVKLENLKELTLHGDYEAAGPFFSTLSKRTATDLSVLPALQKVKYAHWARYGRDVITNILPILSISRVTKLHLGDCVDFDLTGLDARFHLKEVYIRYCMMTSEQLQQFLEACPGLESFNLENDIYGDDEPSALEIVKALESVKDTLRSLYLNLSFRGAEQDWDRPHVIESLEALSNLESLKICYCDLALNTVDEEDESGPWIDKLPKSLKKLSIMSANASISPGLEEITKVAGLTLPKLELVEVDGLHYDCTHLEPLFDQVGIGFERLPYARQDLMF